MWYYISTLLNTALHITLLTNPLHLCWKPKSNYPLFSCLTWYTQASIHIFPTKIAWQYSYMYTLVNSLHTRKQLIMCICAPCVRLISAGMSGTEPWDFIICPMKCPHVLCALFCRSYVITSWLIRLISWLYHSVLIPGARGLIQRNMAKFGPYQTQRNMTKCEPCRHFVGCIVCVYFITKAWQLPLLSGHQENTTEYMSTDCLENIQYLHKTIPEMNVFKITNIVSTVWIY